MQTSNSRPVVRRRAHGTPVDRIKMIVRRTLVGREADRKSSIALVHRPAQRELDRLFHHAALRGDGGTNPLVPGENHLRRRIRSRTPTRGSLTHWSPHATESNQQVVFHRRWIPLIVYVGCAVGNPRPYVPWPQLQTNQLPRLRPIQSPTHPSSARDEYDHDECMDHFTSVESRMIIHEWKPLR